MPDSPFASAQAEARTPNTEGACTEAVCIDANRVYDSCGDKDCLSDLRCYFTEDNQAIINNAVNVRIREADVIYVCMDLEPVPFHRGFYSVDMTFFFDVSLDVFMTPGVCNCGRTINGLSIFSKRVILYGSEGSVKVFSSDFSLDEMDRQNMPSANLPKATVQVAQPIALSAKLKEQCGSCAPPCKIPEPICDYFGGEIIQPSIKSVFVTLGLFSIVQIERNVQLLIPSYDYCIPEKECVNSTDNPCEMFSRIDFPTNEFFPPNVSDINDDDSCSCGHGCHKK